MDMKHTLLTLADTMASHLGVTHFAISMRALSKGDFFKKLRQPGAGCHIRTAEKLVRWFDENWPEDLEWPSDVRRPNWPRQEVA